MNQPCDYFLPGPTFAQTENRNIDLRNLIQLHTQFAHRRAGHYEESSPLQFLCVVRAFWRDRSFRYGRQAFLERLLQGGTVTWFPHTSVGPRSYSFYDLVGVTAR